MNIRVICVVLICSLSSIGQSYSSILLGDEEESTEVYDACTSLDGTSALVVGTEDTGRKSIYIARVTHTPRLRAEWELTYNSTEFFNESGFGISPVTTELTSFPSARYIVCGFTSALHQIPTIHLIDESGHQLQSFAFDSEVHGRFKSVIQTRDGGFALIGETEAVPMIPARVFIMAVDDQLTYRWHTLTDCYESSFTYPNCIMETDVSVGEYLIALINAPLSDRGAAGVVACYDNNPVSSNEGECISTMITC